MDWQSQGKPVINLGRKYTGVELRWGPRLRDVDLLDDGQSARVLEWLARGGGEPERELPVEWTWMRAVDYEAMRGWLGLGRNADRLYLVCPDAITANVLGIVGSDIVGMLERSSLVGIELKGSAIKKILAVTEPRFFENLKWIGLGRFINPFE